MAITNVDVASIPVGRLGILALRSSEELAKKIDNYLVEWRNSRTNEHEENIVFAEYKQPTYLIDASCPRFASGEAKGVINESVRGSDIYFLLDITNYSCTYKLFGKEVPMTPDEHFQDLKRMIAATNGKARRLTVIMPFLYEGRQHRRSGRESLDCALALRELVDMGVSNIITFDAHDPKMQNAIPLNGFENFFPHYQIIKRLLRSEPDLIVDSDHLMVVSPDEGAMNRCIYYSSVLGIDLGMFYKRRDYSRVVNGRNPIIAHEFLGDNVEGKDILIIDDMISSGDSMLDIARELKRRKARNIYMGATYGLFTDGLERFNQAYEQGLMKAVLTTNLTYRSPELLASEWYREVDMSKYIALIIDTLNHDGSLGHLLNPVHRINAVLNEHRENQKSWRPSLF
ncbi:MAG: ribose-phosphate pyrophosphokinase [Eubacteriales bacterium]|nr:ribose-phosphate pyrophosphokinase [Eubacteriales bacterium]